MGFFVFSVSTVYNSETRHIIIVMLILYFYCNIPSCMSSVVQYKSSVSLRGQPAAIQTSSTPTQPHVYNALVVKKQWQ